MAVYLGIDTSNYTTSVALFNSATGEVLQQKQLLPVKEGSLGLKQSDAVFSHVKQLGSLLEQLMAACNTEEIKAVGVSTVPRNVEGSYMPCFLVGKLVAESIASVLKVPVRFFSHQSGHIAAALYSANLLPKRTEPFVAFHFSGGTTECLHITPHEEDVFSAQLIACSLDLKAGQAIDRVGGMLGLPFPAGPYLEQLMEKSSKQFSVHPPFKGMDCSLSGLENQCQKMLAVGEKPEDIAAYCIQFICAVVKKMTQNGIALYPGEKIVYAGGVMSNSYIRQNLEGENRFFAQNAFSSDNAVGTAVLTAIKDGQL